MTYGIIGAMDEEIEHLKSVMTDKNEMKVAGGLFIEGKINNQEVVLAKSGIGKVNAAMITTILIERFNPSYIINTGSAGGFVDDGEVGDVVVGTELVYNDVDVTAFDYEFGQVPQLPPTFVANEKLIKDATTVLEQLNIAHHFGLIATGDTFMSDENRVEELKKIFPSMLASEMEGAAIAQVCYQYDIPFVVIRSLSDIAGKDSSVTFNEFLEAAAKNAANIIIEMIK